MKKLGEAVSRELARFGAAEGMTRIVEAWPEAVGATVARNAWPARLARDGTLHVSTGSSSWAFELAQLEADVLERLHAEVGEAAPRKLRFAVGPLPEPPPAAGERAKRTRAEPRPEDHARAAELASRVEDPELREAIARAAAQSLFEAGDDRPF